MPGLDFGRLTGPSAADTEVHPRDIFAALPARSSRYEYLRDVQREVFDEWYERRSEGDLVIKMNTGNGKTLVGTADQHQRRPGVQHPRGALPGVHRGLTDHADVAVRPAARVRRDDHPPVVRRGRAASA